MTNCTRASTTLKKHAISGTHVESVRDAAPLQTTQPAVAQPVAVHNDNVISANTRKRRSILDCALFCARQNIGLRSHRNEEYNPESGERPQKKTGNFLSWLHFRAESGDQALRAWSHCGRFFDYDRSRSQRTRSQKPAARSHYIFCFSSKRTRCSCSLYLKVLCVPFCLTFFSLITLSFAFAVPRFLCLSPSRSRSPSLSPSGSLLLSLTGSGSLFLTRCFSLSIARCFSLALARCFSLALARCFSLALARCFSLALARCFSLAVSSSHSLSLVVCHSLSLQLCVRLSLSLSLSLISIQDIPCGSKHDVNLPLIIASTTNE